jgi:hypothetical protein
MSWFNPKKVSIGKDVKKIIFSDNQVTKYFYNDEGYNKTIEFLEIIKDSKYFPKILNKDKQELKIVMENCGDLLSVKELPSNWNIQFNELTEIFIKNNIFILDLRFLPYTPFVINNICLKNNKLYLIDLVLFRKRNKYYILFKMGWLKLQIKLYIIFKNYIPLLFIFHFILEILRLLVDFILDVFIFRDV